jgi:formylmethanofuran dehydrogenase subunit A
MDMLEGRRAHFCHLQFLGYGGEPSGLPTSGAADVARVINESPNVTVDVGQIIFGPATTMTSDGPLEFYLRQLTGNKWLNDDVEGEIGGGVVPIDYRPNHVFNAVQWLTGMELFLLIDDPWRVFLTTDHPNAGPFFCYPQVIKLLMDRDYRAQVFEGIHKRAQEGAVLPELDREYSLYEIAIMTRAATARVLGLDQKGHLGVGADADVTIYRDLEDREEMFAHPAYVLKDGEVVVRDGELVRERPGRTFHVAPEYDRGIEAELRTFFEDTYTISFDNYPVAPEYLPHGEVIPCA